MNKNMTALELNSLKFGKSIDNDTIVYAVYYSNQFFF